MFLLNDKNLCRLQSIKSQKTICFTVNTLILINLVFIRNVSDKIVQPNTWSGAKGGLRAGYLVLNMLRQAKYNVRHGHQVSAHLFHKNVA
jgi:hypothetical protein